MSPDFPAELSRAQSLCSQVLPPVQENEASVRSLSCFVCRSGVLGFAFWDIFLSLAKRIYKRPYFILVLLFIFF